MCALVWYDAAETSLTAGRATHAVAHATKALEAITRARNEGGLVTMVSLDAITRARRESGEYTRVEYVAHQRNLILTMLSRALEATGSGHEAQARARLQEAADLDHAEAQLTIADRAESTGDLAEAARWYGRCVALSHARVALGEDKYAISWRRLGVVRLQDGLVESAADAFYEGARAGDADAQYNLGRLHHWRQLTAVRPRLSDNGSVEAKAQGEPGTEPEVWREASIYWYQLAADQGLAVAQYHLASALLASRRPADRAAACGHFLAAAKSGDADSMWELHEMMRVGRGCEVNHDDANRWLAAAAELGQPEALRKMELRNLRD